MLSPEDVRATADAFEAAYAARARQPDESLQLV